MRFGFLHRFRPLISRETRRLGYWGIGCAMLGWEIASGSRQWKRLDAFQCQIHTHIQQYQNAWNQLRQLATAPAQARILATQRSAWPAWPVSGPIHPFIQTVHQISAQHRVRIRTIRIHPETSYARSPLIPLTLELEGTYPAFCTMIAQLLQRSPHIHLIQLDITSPSDPPHTSRSPVAIICVLGIWYPPPPTCPDPGTRLCNPLPPANAPMLSPPPGMPTDPP